MRADQPVIDASDLEGYVQAILTAQDQRLLLYQRFVRSICLSLTAQLKCET